MSDLAKWKVRGPVKTLRTEFALWDLDREQWQPPQHGALTSFRPDGKVSSGDFRNSDGSIAHSRWLYDEADRLMERNSWLDDGPIEKTVYSYDEAGRHQRTRRQSTATDMEISSYDARGLRTKVCFLDVRGDNVAYGVEGTEQSYGAPGAATMIVTDGEHGMPAQVVFQAADGRALREVLFERDPAGKLLKEQVRIVGEAPFPEEFKKIFGDVLSRIAYAYDSRGRLIERTTKFAGISEMLTTFRYDDGNDPVEETTQQISREAGIDDNGVVQYSSATVSVQHTRFEYRHDQHGNWTERIVSNQQGPSNIERRALTYY
jgi:hypothetical protein